jgi:LPS sulfotransferase NodH
MPTGAGPDWLCARKAASFTEANDMKVSVDKPAGNPLAVSRPTFVIVGMMRSGSNLLERQLSSLADVRCHGELFNPGFIGFSHPWPVEHAGYQRNTTGPRDADEIDFFNKIDAACDRPIMGFRLFLDHGNDITPHILYDTRIKKIVLSRNLLESYVSLQTAQDTGVWLTTEKKNTAAAPIDVSIDEFMTFALRQALYYNEIQTILHATNQPYLQLDYTEAKDLARINEIAEFVGSSERFQKIEEPIKKQSTGKLDDRIESYGNLVKQMRSKKVARWFIPYDPKHAA